MTLCATVWAQDDDLYFTPEKSTTTSSQPITMRSTVSEAYNYDDVSADAYGSMDTEEYNTGSIRDVDEYNRRGRYAASSPYDEYYNAADTSSVYGAGDSILISREDYENSLRMKRFDGYNNIVLINADPWYYDPWYYDDWRWYSRWYSPWYWSWYDPWYYGSRWYYGWYGGWYGYRWGGWYGGGRPYYAGWHGGGWYGGRGGVRRATGAFATGSRYGRYRNGTGAFGSSRTSGATRSTRSTRSMSGSTRSSNSFGSGYNTRSSSSHCFCRYSSGILS